jgi:AcrR family transcriptional regulator
MGRLPKFDKQSIAAATLELVAEGGPRAATVAAIAERLGAPTGSIYHRYGSRDLLLAELWMTVVEDYQDGFVAAVEEQPDAVEAAVHAALYMPGWVRGHMNEARLLLLHRREHFVSGEWPDELVQRADALKGQMVQALKAYSRRRFGTVSRSRLERSRFAMLDVPFGAVKPYVQEAKPPPRLIDELIEQTVRAVLGENGGNRENSRNKGAVR